MGISGGGGDKFLSVLESLGLLWAWRAPTEGDVTINGADQTFTPASPGVKRLTTLTFATAHLFRSLASPAIVVVDTLVANAAGVLAFEASGAPAIGADPVEDYPLGGRAILTGEAIGGYGGGAGIVLAREVRGSAVPIIRANGTAGNRNTTASTGAIRAGEGALSARYRIPGYSPSNEYAPGGENWVGTIGNGAPAWAATLLLAPGGDYLAAAGYFSYGGGTGARNATTGAGGGSGFGGGGGARGGGATPAVGARVTTPNLQQVLNLILGAGCKGGGGGAATVNTPGTDNSGGGGGGGAVVLIVDTETQVATLTASGGAAVGPNASAGGAGITRRMVV